jgi:hypothetical protein
MDLDIGVDRPDRPIRRTFVSGVEQLSAARIPSEPTLCDSFVRRHTEFRSVDGFCEAGPCEGDRLGDLLRHDADERDRFVAATTEFDDWAAMRRTATIEDAIDIASR